ncbi:hypothetical protein COOONC_10811 [Cooperia oncophora]
MRSVGEGSRFQQSAPIPLPAPSQSYSYSTETRTSTQAIPAPAPAPTSNYQQHSNYSHHSSHTSETSKAIPIQPAKSNFEEHRRSYHSEEKRTSTSTPTQRVMFEVTAEQMRTLLKTSNYSYLHTHNVDYLIDWGQHSVDILNIIHVRKITLMLWT